MASVKDVLNRWADSLELFVLESLNATPSSQQLRVIKDIDNGYNRISIKSGHGCFAKGTQVMKYDGTFCNVEDIVVGDQLMGDDSTRRNVLELYRGNETMYRFTLMDGVVYEFNESHILCLVATQTHGRQTAGDKVTVTVKDWLKWSDRKKRTHAFYRKPTTISYETVLPIDPYTLGVWLGDGSSSFDYIWLGDKKRDVLNKIDADFKADEKGCKKYKLNILQELKALNLINNKHIPIQYLQVNRSKRLELLAGLLDTDGSIDRFSYEWSTKSIKLAKDMQYLIKSVGCHATIKTKTVKGKDYYRLSIARNITQIPTVRLKTPQDTKRQRDNLHFGIKSVECLGMGNYYGFELDGNHKFLGADFSVLHNTGKSSLMAWVNLWVGLFKYDAKLPVTAPTAPQLRTLLLPEIAKWRERLPKELKREVEVQADKVVYGSGNVATARTARKEAPEGLQGFHASYLMWQVDEASGVPNTIFDVIEGSLTGGNDLVILTANPTRTNGYFYDTHNKNRSLWRCHTFNAEESENVSKESIERKKQQYGPDSDAYRVRVLGQFPRQNTNGLFDLADLEKAMNEEWAEWMEDGALVYAQDVARFGNDESIFCERQGMVVRDLITKQKQRTTELAAYIAYRDNEAKADGIIIDSIGVGGGVIDQLFSQGIDVIEGDVSAKASDSRYLNKRAEMYFALRDAIQRGLKLPNDEKLTEELLATSYTYTDAGKIKIVSKDEIKEELGRSPDRSDAVALTYYTPIASREFEQFQEHHISDTRVDDDCIW
jgi:hypothetical protein